MKTKEREHARRLRSEEGRSIKEIARLLRVSTSSVSRWVRDVELTEAQHRALRLRNPAYNCQLVASRATAGEARDRRRSYQEDGRAFARRGDALHAAGCMLFWAEGSKDRNAIVFTNSDPAMMRFFLGFLRARFAVPDEKVRVTCDLFADNPERQHDIEQFWLDALGLPRTCLRKSTVNAYSKQSQKKRRNKLPYGTCRLAVHDTRLVQSLYGSVQEYAGFSRPEWLG
jgi:hypothetical protein